MMNVLDVKKNGFPNNVVLGVTVAAVLYLLLQHHQDSHLKHTTKIHQHDITIHKMASVASCKNNEWNLLSQIAIFNAKNKYILKKRITYMTQKLRQSQLYM